MKQDDKTIKGIPFSYRAMIDYQGGSIVSRTLIDREKGNVTLFAFDRGQKLSEHTAPFDALVDIVEGTAHIVIEGKTHNLETGHQIIMPAGVPHAVEAAQKFKMILVMIRS